MGFLDDWRQDRKNEPIIVEEEVHKEVRKEVREHKTSKVDRAVKRIYDSTYRNKNKVRINAQRRQRDQKPLGAYNKARRRAKGKGQYWDLSFDNWLHVWTSCPKIFDDSVGIYRMAWTMRGGDIQRNTQMRRKDLSKGWVVSNVEIIYRNQPVPEHGILAEWDWKTNSPKTEG